MEHLRGSSTYILTRFLPAVSRKSKIIPQERNIGINVTLCVIPDHNIPLFQSSSQAINDVSVEQVNEFLKVSGQYMHKRW